MSGWATSILMYHSVSDRGGATSIAPAVFAMQMRALAQSGVPCLTLGDWADLRGAGRLPARSVVVTFDDGFADFDQAAWPVMRDLGIRPIVYLPTDYMGGREGWRGIADPPRPLMGWDRVEALAGQGVLFGNHTRSHPDLTALSEAGMKAEVQGGAGVLADRLGAAPAHFAPPYGLAGPRERAVIARAHVTSVGTRLGVAGQGDDLHDLPRIEMFYFQNPARWQAHLAGRGGPYLALRRTLRAVKGAATKPWVGLK